jgi:hypothetical protein
MKNIADAKRTQEALDAAVFEKLPEPEVSYVPEHFVPQALRTFFRDYQPTEPMLLEETV